MVRDVQKGTIMDLFTVGIVILVFALSILIASTIYFNIKDANDANPILNQTLLDTGESIVQTFDAMWIFFVVGAFIAMIVTGFLIDTHPVFFVASLLIFIFAMVVNIQFANVFLEVASADQFITTANDELPNLTLIYQNYPLIVMVFGIILLIVLYSRIKGGGSSGGL